MIGLAVRRLRRAPGFTILTVSLLAVGIASVTAMYTVIERVVLRPLPVLEQDRLVVAWTDNHARDVEHFPYFAMMYDAARDGAPALEGLAAAPTWGTTEIFVDGPDGEAATLRAAPVLGDFFGVLGVEAVVGRVLRADEDVASPPERVAVISDGLWSRRFARSPDVVGRSIVSRTTTFTIVGVLPADFDYPKGADFWTPIRPLYGRGDDGRLPPLLELDLVGRLAPGATADVLASQLEALSHSDPELERIFGTNTEPVVRPFADVVLGELRGTLWLLFAGAALLLLVAALDAANLVLVRAVGRRQGTAVRRALGAGRHHLLGEALAEAAVLALAAAVVGAAAALVSVEVLVPLAPPGLPRIDAVTGLPPAAYAVAVAVSVGVVLVAVLLPLWHAGRSDPASVLRASIGASASAGAARTRQALVGGQVALTVWVLIVGALMVRTLVNLQSIDPGLAVDGLTVVSLQRPPTDATPDARVAELASTIARLEAIPGVLGATHLLSRPLPGTASYQSIVFLEGQAREDATEANPFMFLQVVEPDVFDVLGVAVVQGRSVSAADDAGAAPVAVVNETAARRWWPGEDAVGQRVRVPVAEYADTWWTVVGVVADTRYDAFPEPRASIYFPIAQFHSFIPSYLLVRTDPRAPPVLGVVRDVLAETSPTVRATGATAVRSSLDEPLATPRFAALLLLVIAGVTLVLAVGGVYGVMAFLVRSRRRELGVRMACGATPARIGELVVRKGLLLAAGGAAVGAAAAVASGALFEALLYGVEPTDAVSVSAAMVVAVIAALAACGIPTLRAAGVDPAEILRES